MKKNDTISIETKNGLQFIQMYLQMIAEKTSANVVSVQYDNPLESNPPVLSVELQGRYGKIRKKFWGIRVFVFDYGHFRTIYLIALASTKINFDGVDYPLNLDLKLSQFYRDQMADALKEE